MSAATSHGSTPYYFVPSPSRHPVSVSFGLFLMILGASQWVNGASWAAWVVLAGFVVWAFVLQQWFRQAISESEGGLYGKRIDVSFRWSMSWFIFSEVMFFSAFFGALYWARVHSLPDLGDLDNAVLWPDFKAVWPSAAPGYTGSPAGIIDPFATMGPWPLPTLNTALLLTSGVTLTIAHHALIAGKRVVLVDDSIVRGTTSVKIVQMMRDAGAKEVHLRIASPPTKHSCFYGVDTPERSKLIASQMSVEKMARYINADSLAFISIDGLYRALGDQRDAAAPQRCDACFTGEYPTTLTDCDSDGKLRPLSLVASR